MKVLGKKMGKTGSLLGEAPVGAYIALEPDVIFVEKYRKPVEEDKPYHLRLLVRAINVYVRKSNGDYLDFELANSLIKNLTIKEVLYLDEYDMGIFEA